MHTSIETRLAKFRAIEAREAAALTLEKEMKQLALAKIAAGAGDPFAAREVARLTRVIELKTH